ncbi:hypothetical protein M0R45_019611 [Rubus argutus]|uniref:Uncharacterized protein n=1 Tax=Rubus argutus TaxID=59490 RepID=A0AAW1X5U4_RUBAR
MPSPARVDPVLTCPCTTGRIKCADPVVALGVVTHSNPPPLFIDLFCPAISVHEACVAASPRLPPPPVAARDREEEATVEPSHNDSILRRSPDDPRTETTSPPISCRRRLTVLPPPSFAGAFT